MTDLAEFLLARLADEAAAVNGRLSATLTGTLGADGESSALRVAWDRRRVLAEVEAKRQIVERVRLHEQSYFSGWTAAQPPRWVLKLLALPYADHPDYRPEWRP